MEQRTAGFWEKFPGLVWSNPNASDAVQIRAALTEPRFEVLLEIAQQFGLERLRAEWAVLTEEGTAETRRAQPIVERIFGNIEKGFALAATGNWKAWDYLKVNGTSRAVPGICYQ
jgi:hypothetical protein